MEIMTDRCTALELVTNYMDLIGQYMKADNGHLVRINNIEAAEWDTGNFYDVFLVGHQKSKTNPANVDEIRVCLWDYLDEMGMLHELPSGITPPDPYQKYFTTNMDLAFLVAENYKHLTKSKKQFRPPNSQSYFAVNQVKVYLMPDMDEPSYQVLVCFDPLLNNTLIRKENLEVGIKTIDLLVFLQSEGIDVNKDNHLKDFIQVYL